VSFAGEAATEEQELEAGATAAARGAEADARRGWARSGGRHDLEWSARLLILRSSSHGMTYLHSQGIIHRDLKSANLLVDSIDRPTTVKICDFGLSFRSDSSIGATLASCGTPQWCAPEVLRADRVGMPSDVYSFGVVCWELAALDNQPFPDMSPIRVAHEVAYSGLTPLLSDGQAAACPAGIVALMKSCWVAEPDERPSFNVLVQRLDEVVLTRA
jgi:serine/threonine protein kinase